jgi:serine/threonine-protein phosphatase PP1 catalytic subunit
MPPDFDVDRVIARLLAMRDRPLGAASGIPATDIHVLLKLVTAIFLDEPSLLDLRAPLTICGDIHGQYHDLLRIFAFCGHPPDTPYLFLGDYVDRGLQSVETVCLLFAYKVKFPGRLFLLRGNHESACVTLTYGFYAEVLQHYSASIWRAFCDTFNAIPIAAVIDGKIFCVHAGLSPDLRIDSVRALLRPAEVPGCGLLFDLLWSDPDPQATAFAETGRGNSLAYGPRAVAAFLAGARLELLCRAHLEVPGGYAFPFEPDRSTVTIFSAPNYCYESGNRGAVLRVEEDLLCRFAVFEPVDWVAEIGAVAKIRAVDKEARPVLFDAV